MSETPPTITLRGAWQGQAGDPERSFQGTVTSAGHQELPVGRAVRVAFEHSGRRVTVPGDHGSYVLYAGGPSGAALRLVLSRFTCQAAAGTQLHDESQDDDWDALPAQG